MEYDEKLQSEGYCDINPLIGRPRTSKSEIENNLKRLDSPLAKVFAGKYATNTKELETIMLPVLKELEEKMKRLFSDIELREKFGNNAKEFANKEYSPENYYKKLEKIYKNLIGVK